MQPNLQQRLGVIIPGVDEDLVALKCGDLDYPTLHSLFTKTATMPERSKSHNAQQTPHGDPIATAVDQQLRSEVARTCSHVK